MTDRKQPDLLDLLEEAIHDVESPLRQASISRTAYAATTQASHWLDDHLRFTVPWCIADLDRHARTARPVADWGLTYADHVANRLAQIGRDLGGTLSSREPQRSIPSIIGALGDSLMGESRPGRGATVGMAMAWGLAGVALLCNDGATWHGMHWCHLGGCTCGREEAA